MSLNITGNISIVGSVSIAANIGIPPSNTELPYFETVPTAGVSVTCNTGQWLGDEPITYQYNWVYDSAPVPEADYPDFFVPFDGVGKSLYCEVTATNEFGSELATTDTAIIEPELDNITFNVVAEWAPGVGLNVVAEGTGGRTMAEVKGPYTDLQISIGTLSISPPTYNTRYTYVYGNQFSVPINNPSEFTLDEGSQNYGDVDVPPAYEPSLWPYAEGADSLVFHITDSLGNDVVPVTIFPLEYPATNTLYFSITVDIIGREISSGVRYTPA